jgi:hypothetical protein
MNGGNQQQRHGGCQTENLISSRPQNRSSDTTVFLPSTMKTSRSVAVRRRKDGLRIIFASWEGAAAFLEGTDAAEYAMFDTKEEALRLSCRSRVESL